MTGRTWKFYSITVIVQYIKVLTSLWAFSCSNTSTERREGWWGKKNTWYQFWSNGFQGVHICCVIEMQSSASLPPPIFVVYGTACHTFAWVGGTWGRAWVATEKPCIIRVRPLVDLVRQLIRVLFHCTGGRNVGQSASHYRKPFIIRMRPLVDLVRQLIRVLSSILAGWFVPFSASCTAPRSACLSLSSQWPILHHRWGRQKGETTARLLFGETRSLQLSERRGREEEWRERKKG